MTGFEIIGMVGTMVSGAMSAMGTIAAGKAQAAQAEAQAQQLEWQRKYNETYRKIEEGEKRIAADLAKKKKEQALGTARTKFAGGGFLPGDHSSTSIEMAIEKGGTFDELMHLAGGQMARFEGKGISSGLQMSANLERMKAQDKSYMAGAAGTLIGGIGSGFGSLSAKSFSSAPATTSGWGGTVAYGQKAPTQYHPYG